MTRHRGFTLVEMMAAIAVFGVLGLLSFQLLRYSMDNSRTMLDRGERLIEMQRAMDVIQRDLQQLVLRRVRDEDGEHGSLYRLGGDLLAFEFTRAGWQNYRLQQRSELQRVGYRLFNGTIFRTYWNVLDRSESTVPQVQSLLSGVDDFQITGISAEGEEVIEWPRLTDEETPEMDNLMVGLKIVFDVPPFGAMERIWALPVSRSPDLMEEKEDVEQQDDEEETQAS